MKRLILLFLLLMTTCVYASQRTFEDQIIDSDLTVDTNTLFVDASENEVGINTLSPAEALDVEGNIRASGVGIFNSLSITNRKETTQTGIDGTTTIPLNSLYMKLESIASDVTVTANPRIANGTVSGDILVLEGTSDTDKLIFADGNGLSMGASVTLGDKDILAFIWNNTLSRWIMLFSDTK